MSPRRISLLLGFAISIFCGNANAWFFFYLPVGKISDAMTHAEGDNCVKDSARVGDVIQLASGNTAIIKSVSGQSSRCPNPDLPIRAKLEFSTQFTSKAALEIPEGFEPKNLTDVQRAQGYVLRAEHPIKKTGVLVTARKKDGKIDTRGVAHAVAQSLSKAVSDVTTNNEEETVISGMPALRFELTGKNKGVFGRTFTYMVTVIDGTDELLVVNAWAPTDSYEEEKVTLRQISASVKGLTPNNNAVATTLPVTPSTSRPAAATLTPNPGTEPEAESDSARKLRELDTLRRDGVITASEYEQKKSDMLKAF